MIKLDYAKKAYRPQPMGLKEIAKFALGVFLAVLLGLMAVVLTAMFQ